MTRRLGIAVAAVVLGSASIAAAVKEFTLTWFATTYSARESSPDGRLFVDFNAALTLTNATLDVTNNRGCYQAEFRLTCATREIISRKISKFPDVHINLQCPPGELTVQAKGKVTSSNAFCK